MGATRMLQEGGYQFDILDSQSDFDCYRLLLLPDTIPVDETLGARLQAYLDQGGALIASFASGMDVARNAFTLDLGVTLNGEGARDLGGELVRGREFPSNDYVDYILPREAFSQGLPRTEHTMYMRGMDVAAHAEAEVLVDLVAPYFDRTYKHFCSHKQTPSSGQIVGPAVVQAGRRIYFCHPIFSQYQTRAPRWCKQLLFNAIDRFLPDPLVRLDAPTATIAALNRQPEHNRLVLHLLYYVPERRCEQFDVIEDVVPLYNVQASVKVDAPPSRVRLVPQGESLPFSVQDGRVTFVVPQINGHQMIELA
jgi:hypothetical protein